MNRVRSPASGHELPVNRVAGGTLCRSKIHPEAGSQRKGGPMPEKLRENPADKASHSATRRELFQMGGLLAMPALLAGSEAVVATGPLKIGRASCRDRVQS